MAIHKADKPLLLTLSCYEPADWHFQIDQGVKIAGILVSGIYEQRVFDIPGNVQIIDLSKADGDYGEKFYGPVTETEPDNVKKMNTLVKKLMGRKPDQVVNDLIGNGKLEVN